MGNKEIILENSIVVKASFPYLEMISDFIRQQAGLSNLGFKKTWELMLAIDEITSNIVSYAASDKDNCKIKVVWKVEKNCITVSIYDNGRPFNPLKIPEEESNLIEENKRLGGMNPELVKKMVDEAFYKRENGLNCVMLKKYTRKA